MIRSSFHSSPTMHYNGIRFVLLAILAAAMLFPMVWIVLSSLKPLEQVFIIPVKWIPDPIQWRNYRDAWIAGNFTQALINSVIVLVAQVSIQVFTSALAGYGFAKHNFPGKEILFVIVLSMTLLPIQIIMIPLFVIVRNLGWINTYQGLILPIAVSAFGVFLMRQFITAIPSEYIDAARVDGLSELGIFFQIIMPMCRPALVTLTLLAGLASWDEFLWPLLVVSDHRLETLPLAVATLKSLYQAPAHHILAIAVLMALPLLIVFLLAQEQIVESAGQTGLKG